MSRATVLAKRIAAVDKVEQAVIDALNRPENGGHKVVKNPKRSDGVARYLDVDDRPEEIFVSSKLLMMETGYPGGLDLEGLISIFRDEVPTNVIIRFNNQLIAAVPQDLKELESVSRLPNITIHPSYTALDMTDNRGNFGGRIGMMTLDGPFMLMRDTGKPYIPDYFSTFEKLIDFYNECLAADKVIGYRVHPVQLFEYGTAPKRSTRVNILKSRAERGTH